MNSALIDWVRRARANGFADEKIYESLIHHGYSHDHAKDAIAAATGHNMFNSYFSKEKHSRNQIKPIRPATAIVVSLILLSVAFGGLYYIMASHISISQTFKGAVVDLSLIHI